MPKCDAVVLALSIGSVNHRCDFLFALLYDATVINY